jgi:hypothetical protein
VFQVAIIVNENEVAHSTFADTVALLKRPVSLGDQKLQTYRFSAFDKYNVHRLFVREDEHHLANFDSLIIATNATNNLEVLSALRANAEPIENFLRNGKGILVCSQKKLSQKVGTGDDTTGFLPDRYEYSLYDRPEVSSADGAITEAEPLDRIFRYPNEIADDLVEYHCTNNSFMVHRYRSYIVPRHPSQYLALLTDAKSPPVDKALRATLDLSRALLLRTGSNTERLVVTSMALDWAGHDELLENILIYITEGTGQIAVLRRHGSHFSKAMDAYVIRARVAKIPVREYFDVEPSQVMDLHHRTVIVSAAFSKPEVEQMWAGLTSIEGRSTDLYHMTPDESTGGFQLSRRSHRSALDGISASAGAWLGRSFIPSLWGRSIWTYNYVLPMMVDLGIDVTPYLAFVFADIRKHIPHVIAPLASYDNVTNASTQMLEILGGVFLRGACTPDHRQGQLSPQELFDGCATWILGKLLGAGVQPIRDRLYMLNSLSRVSYLNSVDETVRQQIWATANDALKTYRAKTYRLCDTVELTQVLELALVLGAEEPPSEPDCTGDISSILSILRSRQGANGEWRNISETGEVTLSLIRLAQKHPRLADDYDATEAILQGVGFLLRDFDPRLGNWQDDINATAKAAHALALFDKHSGLSASDFFADIQARIALWADAEALEARLTHEGKLLATLFRNEGELAEKVNEVVVMQDLLKTHRYRLRRHRFFTFAAVVLALITGSTLTLVLGILFLSYRDVATKLLGDWHEYLISAFVGIVLTLVFMGVYSMSKERILKDDA